MIPVTQPLRDEHCALLPELAAVRGAADAIGTSAGDAHVARARLLLGRHLLPHMFAEEAVLYPAIDRLIGNEATATLRLDHDEIRERIRALDELRTSSEAGVDGQVELRALLYGLDAIIWLHIRTEEEIFYPVVDERLGDVEAAELVAAIREVERDLLRRARTPVIEVTRRP